MHICFRVRLVYSVSASFHPLQNNDHHMGKANNLKCIQLGKCRMSERFTSWVESLKGQPKSFTSRVHTNTNVFTL
jgi:hypothetical protein